ncbi:MAG TPA: type IV toxin-antitoxin system AbiEi family antitoxin domain-containing protein [Nocardioidaceae bacterium]|nr:type IV toxin-antitoxin system AbiEi family antitoxin domain-containing protein [Nocardioidaceae bacterium]
MDPRLQVLIAQHGVFFRWEALDLGYDDKTLTKLVRRGVLHRVRRGAYIYSVLWHAATPEERHRIRCRAVLRALGDGVVLSHVSSLVMRGVATWGVDLSKVHVTRLDDGASRVEPDLVHHRGQVTEGELEVVGGLLVTPADRAVMEALMLTGVEPGLVMADSALHKSIIDPDGLERTRRELERWPGMRSAQLVVRLADGRAESPGETRVRYICWEQGLPKPDLQVKIRDARGVVVAVTDFGWEKQKLLGEFDGRVKYGRLLKPGEEPGDAVIKEKEREDLVRELTDFRMIRYMWQHLDDHSGLAARTARLFRRAA